MLGCVFACFHVCCFLDSRIALGWVFEFQINEQAFPNFVLSNY